MEITGYRSILCFWQDRETGERTAESGPWAVDAFVNARIPPECCDPSNLCGIEILQGHAGFRQAFQVRGIFSRLSSKRSPAKLGDRLPPKGNCVVIGRPVILQAMRPTGHLPCCAMKRRSAPSASPIFIMSMSRLRRLFLCAAIDGGFKCSGGRFRRRHERLFHCAISRWERRACAYTAQPDRPWHCRATFDYRIIDNAVSPLSGQRYGI